MIIGGSIVTLFGDGVTVKNNNISETWPYTLIIVLGSVFIAVVFSILVIITYRHGKSAAKYRDELNTHTNEIYTGVRVIRAFGAEQYHQRRFASTNKKFAKSDRFLIISMCFT
jgi:ATP-binding cassette subfamily B protein